LGINYLETETLRRMIGSQRFTARLPLPLSRLMPYLTGADAGIAPGGLLINTAVAFGEQWRDLVLIRLAEASVSARRADLVDTPALAGLVGLLATPWGKQYSQTLQWIARNVATDEGILQHLDDPGPTYLLQILLATGAYVDLANEMLHQARLLYPGDKQNEYLTAVRRIFAETPISAEDIPTALKTIGDTGIRMLPLALAYIGALEGHEFASALDPAAETVTEMILDNRSILELIHPSAMIALLKFHIKRKDVNNTIKLAGAVANTATRDGSRGISVIGRMYKLMDWDERVRLARMELLRRFVRDASDEDARKAVNVFGREFGAPVQRALEGTYALKRMMDGVGLAEYAEFLRISAEFLHDTALAYINKDRAPTVGAILNNLESMPGGLTDEDRKVVVRELLGLGKAILVLGDHARANRPREMSKHIDALLAGKTNPVTALDVFYVMSGYLTKGKRYNLKLESLAKAHPLGERGAPSLRDDSQISNGLLRGAVRAFSPDRRIVINAEVLRQEMESLWGAIPLGKQREIVRQLAKDLQRVAELTALIAEQGNEKALEDSTLARRLEEGKQQPRNTLEFYRLIAGYFKARIR
jgi:hypothetical protein